MNRFPDNPKRVSLDFLRTLDADPPGTWLAQPKLDGWRKIADSTTGTWHYGAKHTKGDAAKPLPPELRKEFESLPWPKGIVLDCEWVGCRVVEHVKEHCLHVFDILMYENDWLGNMGFWERYKLLALTFGRAIWDSGLLAHVHLVPCWQNPGLVDKFMEQLQDPLSEGLVVRHKDSGLVGSFSECATNPQWFKIKYREVKCGQLK